MDDKWLIFLEGEWLSIYRAYSYCIHQVRLEPAGRKYRIAEAFVNRDPKQYNYTDDDYDARLLLWLIDAVILDKDVSVPIPPELQD